MPEKYSDNLIKTGFRDSQILQVRYAAEKCGLTVAEFIRTATMEKVEKVTNFTERRMLNAEFETTREGVK